MSIQSRPDLEAQRSSRSTSTDGLATHEVRPARAARREGVLRSLRVALLGVALASVLGGVGCGGGSGGGSGTDPARTASAPIDLAPGRTSAVLSWEASDGAVEGYDVYLARGNGAYVKAAFVREPAYSLRGTAGDRVRMIVIAVGTNGTRSQPSPASPTIRFHAAPTAATQSVASSSSGVLSSGGGGAQETVASAAADVADDAAADAEGGESPAEDATEAIQPIDAVLRDQLLVADARLPVRGPGPNAAAWLQSAVDDHVGAGVSLAGTGELGGDVRRDLVWVDAVGQLFTSDGADLAATDDVPNTFVEAIRLEATERFVALADLDGDGRGDWVLEDRVTRTVWAGPTDEGDLESVPAPESGASLLGVGDFDGDGRGELLWAASDLALRFGTGDGAAIADDSDPQAFADLDADALLAIADVNGDGRDDLIFQGEDDRLALGVSMASGGSVAFVREAGPDADTRGRELVGTLDADGDGAADVAWWSDDVVYLWDLYDGP